MQRMTLSPGMIIFIIICYILYMLLTYLNRSKQKAKDDEHNESVEQAKQTIKQETEAWLKEKSITAEDMLVTEKSVIVCAKQQNMLIFKTDEEGSGPKWIRWDAIQEISFYNYMDDELYHLYSQERDYENDPDLR